MTLRNPERVGEKLVFILGVHSRSGTNYLRDLLCLHPQFDPSPIGEDYILAHSQHLRTFADGMKQNHKLVNPDDVLGHLGAGLEQYLMGSSSFRDNFVVCKTPTCTDAGNIRQLFPASRIIFIVRDPRDVAESARVSFGYSLDEVARRWNRNADIIFDMQSRDDFPTTVARYECLASPDLMEEHLRELFAFSGAVVPNDFPWTTALSLPVRGSCELRQRGQALDWQQRDMGPDFAPLGRWRKAWDSASEARFSELISKNMRRLCYFSGQQLREMTK